MNWKKKFVRNWGQLGMKCKETTAALRFADTFAPSEGTIQAHQNMIDKQGFVWYGKLGAAVSSKVANLIMENENPRILLIHSGKTGRYWAYIKKFSMIYPLRVKYRSIIVIMQAFSKLGLELSKLKKHLKMFWVIV